VDSGTHDNKDRRAPAKKNKIQLDITEEEEDVAPGTRTPPSHPPPDLTISPPHEIKVRLIRQGVEDLNWQNPLASANQAEVGAGDILATEFPPSETPVNVTTDLTALPDSADSNRESVMELRGDDPETGLSPANAQAPVGRLDSDSDGAEKEKGLKRKFGARAISGGLSTSDVRIEPMKRQRDDPPPEASPPPSQESSTAFKLV
jgi:Ran-binding protein 3